MYPYDEFDRDRDDIDGSDDDERIDGDEEDVDDVVPPHVECVAPRWCWEYRECQSGECGVDLSGVVGPIDDPEDDPIY
jgi:hypothetical protein